MSNYSKAIEEMKRRRQEEAEQKTAPSSLLSKAQPEKKDYSNTIELMRRRREYEDKMAVVNAQRTQRQAQRQKEFDKWLETRTQDVIRAELDAAKKKDGDAKLFSGEWWKNIGEEIPAMLTGRMDDVTTERSQKTEEVKKLEAELDERRAFDYAVLTRNKDFEAKSKIGYSPEFNIMGEPKINLNAAYMTDDQRDIYYYLKATEGETAADEYYDFISSELNARRVADAKKGFAEIAEKSPVGASALSVGTGALRGLGYLGQAIDYMAGNELDPNAWYNFFSHATSGLREPVSTKINDKWGKVASYGYDLGMSMADFLAAAGMTGGGAAASILLGSGAAADTTIDALERGVDSGRAILMGTAAGLIEAVTEKVSVDKLLDNYSQKGIRQFILSNMISEASEEAASEIANTITDVILAEDKSYWSQKVQELKRAGYSEGEAFAIALASKLGEVGLAALGGAISGGTLAGGRVAINTGVNALQNAGDKAAERDVAYRGQNTIRDMLNSDKYKDMRTEQQKVTVLPTAVEQERAKARENGEVFDIGYERPYTGYANTVADDELDARVNAAQTVTEKTGIRYGASEEKITEALELGRALGVEVEFFNQSSKSTNTVVDGFYNSQNGHIYVNVNAKKTVPTTISHEFTHSLEGTNEYNDLRDLVAKELKKRGDSLESAAQRLNKLYEKAGRSQDMKAGEADVIANFVEKNILGTQKSINKVVGAKPNLGRRVLAFLNRLLAQLRRGSSAYTTAKQIQEWYDYAVSNADEAPTAEGVEANVANESEEKTTANVESKVEADEEVITKEETPVTEAPERSQNKPKRKSTTSEETKKVPERETAGKTDTGTVFYEDAEEMMREAERAHDAGEITDEQLETVEGIYDEWYETGIKPDISSEGFTEGKFPKALRGFFTGKRGVSWSVSETETFKRDKYFDRQIDKWDQLHSPGYVTVGTISAENPLHKIGIPAGKVYFDVNKIQSSMNSHGDHLSTEILKTIPELLSDPIVLTEYKPGQKSNTVSVYGNLFTEEGIPVTVGIVVNSSLKGTLISKIRTIHARSDFSNQITDKSVLFIKNNKKEINAWFQSLGIDVPLRGTQLGVIRSIDFNNIVTQPNGDVNTKSEDVTKMQYSVSERTELDKNGVDIVRGSAIKYSVSTWTEEEKERVRANLLKRYSAAEVDRWIDDVGSIAATILADRGRLDFEAAKDQVFLKTNQEYKYTLDASTLCAKRLLYQGTFDAIQHRLRDHVFTSDELLDLLAIMKDAGLETPCGVCYVESRRRNLGVFAKRWLDAYEGDYIPHMDELTTTDGREWLKENHPTVYNDFMAAMRKIGTNNPKVTELRTEYRGDIRKLTKAMIKTLVENGGLRVQSFSDFETPHLLDMMQAVLDMSSVKLTSQAYTKVPNFAWVFGDTNIKINLSLIAKGNGFDADGNLAFSSVEGIDPNEAFALRERYSKNVGTIIVGANDAHILACMADDRIDFIIPFHKSGWGEKELALMGMKGYKNYTDYQSERLIETGKKVKENIKPLSYWDFDVDGKTNAETYLKLCAEQGKIPKFSQFLVDNGDGSYSLQPDGSTDGYWKTLIDFKMYDNDGVGSPQMPVVPNFNMDEAMRVLSEYEGGANTLPVANDIVEEFVAKYKDKGLGIQYSVSETDDADYMSAVERGDTETAQRMVDEAAKNAGYDYHLYHGTNADFTKFDLRKFGGANGKGEGYGIYLAANREISAPYGKNIIDSYTQFKRLAEGSARTLSYNELKKIVQKSCELEAERMVEDGEYESTAEAIKDTWISNYVYTYNYRNISQAYTDVANTIWSSNDNDGDIINEIMAASGAHYDYDNALDFYDNVLTPVTGIDGFHYIWGKNDGSGVQNDIYLAFHSEQVKSADPVTYDDNGNVIPLSERFNSENNDIRWSVSKTTEETKDTKDTTDAYSALPTKAKTYLRKVEDRIGRAFDKAMELGLGGESGGYRTPEYREFLKDAVRPITDEYLTTGTISRGTVSAVFEKYYKSPKGLPASLYDQAKLDARGVFENIINENWNDFNAVRRFAEQSRQSKAKLESMAEISREDAKKRFDNLKSAQKFERKVVRDNLLTDDDMLTVSKLLRKEISFENLNPIRDNIKGIRAVYEAKLQTRDAEAAVSEYKRYVKAQYYAYWDGKLDTMFDWKDKTEGIKYQRETLERNIHDIVPDKALANEIIRDVINPVHVHEADSVRWKTKLKNRVEALGISSKAKKGDNVSEAYAVQFYGEAVDNIRMLEANPNRKAKRDGYTLEEWNAALANMWKQSPSLDESKIKNAAEEFRKIYEEIFEEMNNVLIDNGYPPVAYRSGYFPHFTGEEETVLAKFGRLMGIKTEMMALPTTINGLTENFKPGKAWFGHAQERQGIYTTYDAVTGFEQYIKGAADVIFHTEDIQKFRALSNRIRYNASNDGVRAEMDRIEANEALDDAQKEAALEEIRYKGEYALSNFVAYIDEYANKLANKKSRLDRGIESLLGRKFYLVMNNLESRVAANMIALNLGSALTNYIPVNQAAAQLGWEWMLKGMQSTYKSVISGDSIKDASTFLVNRRGYDPIVQTWLDKASNIAGKPMEWVDNMASEMIVRAAYAKNLASGMTSDEALYQADLFAASVMADRSKGAVPLIFENKNPVLKLFTQFQVEVNNEFSVIFKDIPRRERKKWTDAVAFVLLKYFLGAFIYNELYELIVGRRAALDPIGMVVDTAEDIANGKPANTVIKNVGTNVLEQLPFIGGVLGGGRVPISNAMPEWENLLNAVTSKDKDSKKRAAMIWKEASAPIYYWLFPFGGGAVKKVVQTIDTVGKGGRYTLDKEGNALLQYPMFMDTTADKILNPLRSLAFGPSSLPTARDWIDNDFKTFGAKETAVYDGLKEVGVAGRDAYDLLLNLRGAEKTDEKSIDDVKADIIRESNLSGEGKFVAYYGLLANEKEKTLMNQLNDLGADNGVVTELLMDLSNATKDNEKRSILINAELDNDEKRLVYENRISDEQSEAIQAFEEAGLDIDTFIEVKNYNDELTSDKGLTTVEKATMFARWVAKQGFTVEQQEVIQENIRKYTKNTKYDDFTEAGLDDEASYKLASALADLEPLEGKTSVSELQKCRAVIDTLGSPGDQMKALEAVMNKSSYKKCVTAESYGVDAETYVTFREVLEAGDKDGNGSITQAEAEVAIDKMSGNLSDGERWLIELTGGSMPGVAYLTNTQRAVLWQLANPLWNPKNNPYSESVGRAIQELFK